MPDRSSRAPLRPIAATVALAVAFACGGSTASTAPAAPVHAAPAEPAAAAAETEPRLREARRLFWMGREGDRRHCTEWQREADRLSSRDQSRESVGYRVEWSADAEGFTITGAFVGEALLACRHEVRVVGASGAAVRTSAGDLYLSLGHCVGALSEAPSLEDAFSETAGPVLDLGSCERAIELLRDMRPAPDPDPIAALMAGGVTLHLLRPVDGVLSCQAWRSVRRGDRVDLVHRAEQGTATLGGLQYWNDERGPRLGSAAEAWQGHDGSSMALGSYDVRPVRFVDERVFLVGGSAWFAHAADCEAARELEGLAAWLRTRRP